jgi:hypothetical protein
LVDQPQNPQSDGRSGRKLRRGTDKTPVAIGLSLNEMEITASCKHKFCRLWRRFYRGIRKKNVKNASCVATDDLSIYRKLSEKGYIHVPENFDPAESPDHLKWLHIVISNLKSFLDGTYHGVGPRQCNCFWTNFATVSTGVFGATKFLQNSYRLSLNPRFCPKITCYVLIG